MEKFYIKAVIREKGDILGKAIVISLPISKDEIEKKIKELGHSDLKNTHIEFDTNLPDEMINYINYGCYLTEKDNTTIINFGKEYTMYEKFKLYNMFALCLHDLYSIETYGEDYITRLIHAYNEHSAIIVPLDSMPEWYHIKDSEIEFGCGGVSSLIDGTANMLDGRIGFWDYTDIYGDIYTLAAWDIEEYEGETIDDYDDDPVSFLEALTECYELYLNEDMRYVIDIYHHSKEAENEYKNKLNKTLIEMGY